MAEENMGKRSRNGDRVDQDLDRTCKAIDTARHHLQDLERKLEQLQQQLLARGTRSDVLEQARQALETAMKEVAMDLRKDN